MKKDARIATAEQTNETTWLAESPSTYAEIIAAETPRSALSR
jgi:hypothetical protein